MKAIKLALHWQMGIALILGATLGIIFCDSYSAWGNVINGIGDIFADDLTHACRDGADFFGLFARAEIAPEAAHNIWAFNKHKETENEDQDGACDNIANGTKGSSEVVAEFANEVG